MRLAHTRILFAFVFLTSYSCKVKKAENIVYKSDTYSVYSDRVVQNSFKAEAVSPTQLSSNYQSEANRFKSPVLSFKFSINGKDNEMLSGKDHKLVLTSVTAEAPLIKFGKQYLDKTQIPENTYLEPNTKLTLKLDLRDVMQSFRTNGYYTTFNGIKIFKDDFKSVYVAGSISPLTWDFDNLVNNPLSELKDLDGDGIYTVTLYLNKPEEQRSTAASWMLKKDLSAFPAYKSTYPLVDALYNLALDEMVNAVEPDSTFRTGKEWAGVWTRDISYSIILSMAVLQPKVAEYSLLRKVQKNRIIQDTGTGGSYPVSSDRMIWAVAAWELYKTTGSRSWLEKAYTIIRNSTKDDLEVVFNPETGLVRGESSFLDWREQTYPKWMQSADIYESECLGTSAVHYQTNVVLAQMAELLNDEGSAQEYTSIAERIKEGINKYLWIPEKGYYGQYLYGRNHKVLSPRSEALGEALAVLFGIADGDRSRQVIANTPVNDFGIPCIYPQIPNIPPYHNNAVWPFVQSYWSLAAAKAGNEAALVKSLSAIYRPVALFLTNKENFVASTGDFAGTQINSDNMLWTLSGNIGMVYKVLFGMDFKPASLSFSPFVPKVLAGSRTLTNFSYRDAKLDISMEGFGNKIKEIRLNGMPLSNAEVPENLKGKHKISIILANNEVFEKGVNHAVHYVSPAAPEVSLQSNVISWDPVKGASRYKILKDGRRIVEIAATTYSTEGQGEFQVIAIDSLGVESFASEPVRIYLDSSVHIVEIEDHLPKASHSYKGFSGHGFAEISKELNTSFTIEITVPSTGLYAIDFRYANGNGPTNTENKCAFRTLTVDGDRIGTVVFPQRGKEEWSNWGFSNSHQVKLEKGAHRLTLSFESFNANMNGLVNQAMLDYLRLTRTH